jgi:hypothetical protein
MPSIFRNIFSRGENRPAQQPAPAALRPLSPVAPRPLQARIPPPQPAAPVVRAAPALPMPPPQNFTEVVRIGLTNLRVGNESDANLITVPSTRGRALFEIAPPSDPDTDQMAGYDFVDHIPNNNKIPAATRRFLINPDLSKNRTLSADELNEFVYKLKMIASQCNVSSEFRNSIEIYATEGQLHCEDRSGYYFEQIFVKALLNHLSGDQNIDEVDLFNLGAAYFKLELVHLETQKYLNEGDGRDPLQSVHDYFHAEYFLQERLGLPTRHQAPIYGYTGNISRAVATTIGNRVEAAIREKDGVKLIERMSTWEPWANYIQNKDPHDRDFAHLTENFHQQLADFSENRLNPNTDEFGLSENDALEAMMKIGQQQAAETRELIGQKAKEFLLNHRADYLIERGQTPAFFNQNW